MPSNTGRFDPIGGFVFLEPIGTTGTPSQPGYGYLDAQNYESKIQYVYIPCSDCTPPPAPKQTFALLQAYTQSPLSKQSGSFQYDGIVLAQNIPNPVTSDKTDISFSLNNDTQVTLVLYNALGQEVATIANEFLAKGNHIIPCKVQGLPNGIFSYRLTVNGKMFVRQMIILR